MQIGYSLGGINEVAEKLVPYLDDHKVIAFHGEMGSGKTTLISALCYSLGCRSHVSSPTFSIIQEYESGNGEPLFHIDLYRLKNEREAIDAGVEDTLFSGYPCFIEWSEKAPGLLPENTLHIFIKVVNESTRNLSVSTYAEKSF